MFEWIETFLQNVFGNFWASLGTWALKLLMGPVVFFVFGPMFRLSFYVTEKILEQISPTLDKVGISLEGLAAWFIECLRIRESVSMFMTFLVLGLTVSVLRSLIK